MCMYTYMYVYMYMCIYMYKYIVAHRPVYMNKSCFGVLPCIHVAILSNKVI